MPRTPPEGPQFWPTPDVVSVANLDPPSFPSTPL